MSDGTKDGTKKKPTIGVDGNERYIRIRRRSYGFLFLSLFAFLSLSSVAIAQVPLLISSYSSVALGKKYSILECLNAALSEESRAKVTREGDSRQIKETAWGNLSHLPKCCSGLVFTKFSLKKLKQGCSTLDMSLSFFPANIIFEWTHSEASS